MDAIKARRLGRGLDRRREAARLDHENDRFVGKRQNVPPLRVGDGNVPAVGDQNIGDAGIVGAAMSRPAPVLEYDARNDGALRLCRMSAGGQRRRDAARGADEHLAA